MPLAIAIMFTAIGLVLMVVWRLTRSGKPFFRRRGFESVPPEIANEGAPPVKPPLPAEGS